MVQAHELRIVNDLQFPRVDKNELEAVTFYIFFFKVKCNICHTDAVRNEQYVFHIIQNSRNVEFTGCLLSR